MSEEPNSAQIRARSKRFVRLFVVVVVLLLLGWLIGAIVLGPRGGGEYAYSPDGKYVAHLSLVEDPTLFSGTQTYIEILIEDKKTREPIWESTYHPPPNARPYFYGDRTQNFIQWSSNSNSVTLRLDQNGMQITIPVP